MIKTDTEHDHVTDSGPNPAPDALGPRGARLWHEVTERYELDAHELALLEEMARTADDLDALAERVRAQGHTVGGRVNPALVESRQLRIAFARLAAALRLPTGDETDGRPQRRSGVRGTYTLGRVS
ncbi:hypothetical protein ACGFRG_15220 [Streptomyces sp. NPDC048696]|uniref:hypothetical protein n=1 Tax=Streptomyces sp. NPDC048696 TaxID=3365585 RepID=UPI0037178D39